MCVRKLSLFCMLFVLMTCFMADLVFGAARIKSSPRTPILGQNITFNYSNPDTTECLIWDFGDGSGRETLKNSSRIYHSYYEEGRYKVKVWDQFCDWGGPPTASMTVTVKIKNGGADKPATKKGTISFKPRNPKEGEKVTFVGKGFSSSCISWDFGDKAREKDNSPPSTVHSFDKPGKYKIKMYADCGKKLTAQATVKVQKLNRKITAAKTSVYADEAVRFSASGFGSSCIKWDFGDGTTTKGSSNEIHTFKKGKKYTVKAWDYCGEKKITPVSLRFQVKDKKLAVTKVELSFAGGKKTTTIMPGSSLNGRGIINYEGTGKIKYQWLLDNRPHGRVQSVNSQKNAKKQVEVKTVLSSVSEGRHSLSLKIISPSLRKGIKPITYSVGEELRNGLKSKKYDVEIVSLADTSGEVNTADAPRLPLNNGGVKAVAVSLTNGEKASLANGYLLIYLDGKEIGKVPVPLIPAGGMRQVTTDVDVPEDEMSELEFRLVSKSNSLLGIDGIKLDTIQSELKGSGNIYKPMEGVEPEIVNFSATYPVASDQKQMYVDIHVKGAWSAELDVRYSGRSIEREEFRTIPLAPYLGVIDHVFHIPVAEVGGYGNVKGNGIEGIPVTLRVVGMDKSGKEITKQKSIKLHVGDGDKYSGKKPTIKRFYQFAGNGSSVYFDIGFRLEVEDTDFYQIVHLESGEEVQQKVLYSAYKPMEESHRKSGRYKELPGSGVYELRAFNANGVTTRELYILTMDPVLEDWISNVSKRGCFENDQGRQGALKFEGKGRYGQDPDGNGWSYSSKGKKYDCSRFKDTDGYKKYLEYIGVGAKPRIVKFEPKGSSVKGQGEFKSLLLIMSDSSSPVMMHDTTVTVVDNSTGDKITRFIIKSGERENYQGFYSFDPSKRAMPTEEIAVYPKKTTSYTVVVENEHGKATAKTELVVRGYQDIPVISKFGKYDKDNSKGSYNQGEEVILNYGIAHAVSAKIIDHYKGGKIVKNIVVDKVRGVAQGRLVVSPEKTTHYELVATNSMGDSVSERAVVIINQKNRTTEPRIKRFKADTLHVSPGGIAALDYIFEQGDYAVVINKATGEMIDTIEVSLGKANTIGRLWVKPKADTVYQLFVSNKLGSDTMDTTVKLLVMDPRPNYVRETKKEKTGAFDKDLLDGKTATMAEIIIHKFTSSDGGSIAQGETVKLSYKLLGKGGRIVDLLSKKEIHVIKGGKTHAIIEGEVVLKPNQTSWYALQTLDKNKKLHEKSILVQVVQNFRDLPGIDPPKPTIVRFEPDKKTAKPGEIVRFSYQFAMADLAEFYQKSDRSYTNLLPVPYGEYSIGEEPKGIPLDFKGDSITYVLKLRNKNGTKKVESTIKIDRSKIPDTSIKKLPVGTPYTERMNSPKTMGLDLDAVVIEQFKPSKSMISDGDSVTLKYRFRGGIAGRIIDKLSNKEVHFIKAPKDRGLVDSSVSLKPRQSAQYSLEVYDKDGKLRTKNIFVVLQQNFGDLPSHVDPPKPTIVKFNADKRSAAPGESIKLSYQFSLADEAYIYEKSNSSTRTILPVPYGDYSIGEITVKMPGNIVTKEAYFILDLKNKNGGKHVEIPIKIVSPPMGNLPPVQNPPVKSINSGAVAKGMTLSAGITKFEASENEITAGETVTLDYEFSGSIVANIYETESLTLIKEIKIDSKKIVTRGSVNVQPSKDSNYLLQVYNMATNSGDESEVAVKVVPDGLKDPVPEESSEIHQIGMQQSPNPVMVVPGGKAPVGIDNSKQPSAPNNIGALIKDFSASPLKIMASEHTELSYRFSGEVFNAFVTEKATGKMVNTLSVNNTEESGSFLVFPIKTTTYILNVMTMSSVPGKGGFEMTTKKTTKEITVEVWVHKDAPKLVGFMAVPHKIKEGESTELIYEFKNGSWADIHELPTWKRVGTVKGTGVVDKGRISISPRKTTTYRINIMGQYGSVEGKFTVEVVPGQPVNPSNPSNFPNPSEILSKPIPVSQVKTEKIGVPTSSLLGVIIKDFSADNGLVQVGTSTKLRYHFSGADLAQIIDTESGETIKDIRVLRDGSRGSVTVSPKKTTVYRLQILAMNVVGGKPNPIRNSMELQISTGDLEGYKSGQMPLPKDVKGPHMMGQSSKEEKAGGEESKKQPDNKNNPPTKENPVDIDKVEIDFFKSSSTTIQKGKQVNLIYRFRGAVDARIYEELSKKQIQRIKTPISKGWVDGSILLKPAQISSYTLKVYDIKGKTHSRSVLVKVQKKNVSSSGRKLKPVITKFKASSTSVKRGSGLYLSYDFKYADEAYIVDTETKKVLYMLPVEGTRSTGKKLVTIPKGTKKSTYTFQLKLRNKHSGKTDVENIKVKK